MWEKRAERDKRSKEEAETRRLLIAADQHKQHEEKVKQSAEEKRKKMEEGQQIRQLDHEYNSKEHEREARRRLHQTKLMADLNTMRDRARSERQIASVDDHEQDIKIREWYEKKEKLEKTRKEAEEHHFK